MCVSTDFLSWQVSVVFPNGDLSKIHSFSFTGPSEVCRGSPNLLPFSLPPFCLSQLKSLLLSFLCTSGCTFFFPPSVSFSPVVWVFAPVVSVLPSHWEILSRMLAVLLSPEGVLGDLLQSPKPFSMARELGGLLWASMMLSPGLRLRLLRDERLSPTPHRSGRWSTTDRAWSSFNPQQWSLKRPQERC